MIRPDVAGLPASLTLAGRAELDGPAGDLRRGLDLNGYRLRHALSYEALGARIGSTASNARKYCFGMAWPRPTALERIVAATHDEVSVLAMHKTRLAYCRAHGAGRPHELAHPGRPSDLDGTSQPSALDPPPEEEPVHLAPAA